MTVTKLADVIVPEVFNPYFRERSTEVNAFWQSGVVQNVPELAFGPKGGTRIQMPFWQSLTGDAQLLDEDDNLTVNKIQAAQDEAVQHARALVYGANDLAGTLAGDDPLQAIGDYLANNWSIVFNRQLFSTLKGALGSLASESLNTLDIAGLGGASGIIDGASFIDACQTLGDAKVAIAAVAMHSAVEAVLAKNDLIDDIRDSEGKIVMRTFMGKQVIVDDVMTQESGGVYTTILFGAGAVGFGEGNPKMPSEVERNALIGGGEEYLVTRRHWVLHPRGIKWIGTSVKQTPSDAELADPDNWSRVYDHKNIRLVRFLHRVS